MELSQYNPTIERRAAQRLDNEALLTQFEIGTTWVVNQSEDITQSKFCTDMAWFKEVWWELMRRNLLMVH